MCGGDCEFPDLLAAGGGRPATGVGEFPDPLGDGGDGLFDVGGGGEGCDCEGGGGGGGGDSEGDGWESEGGDGGGDCGDSSGGESEGVEEELSASGGEDIVPIPLFSSHKYMYE